MLKVMLIKAMVSLVFWLLDSFGCFGALFASEKCF